MSENSGEREAASLEGGDTKDEESVWKKDAKEKSDIESDNCWRCNNCAASKDDKIEGFDEDNDEEEEAAAGDAIIAPGEVTSENGEVPSEVLSPTFNFGR